MLLKNRMFRHANTDGIKKLVILVVLTIATIISAALVVLPEKSKDVVLPTTLMPPALVP